MSAKSERLKKFIITYLEQLFEEGSGGNWPLPKPGFNLSARDYLRYAEQGLSLSDIANLIARC